jgi:hypothetical protein
VPGRSKKQVPQVSHIRRLTSGGEAVCKCMDRSAVAAILIRHRAAKKVVAKSAVGHRRGPVHLLLLAEPSPPARTEPLAERPLTAQHVGVAPSIVNNNPETTERGRRSFPAAAGWFFARPAVAHEALFTFQTAHLVPAARFCARGLHLCFTHPESRGGRSAEKRSGACEAPVGTP